jgi:transcriptional regulator with XRE-family HTH domain
MTSNDETPNLLRVRLCDAIKKSGWSFAEVCRRAEVGNVFIYDVLSGKSRNPTAAKLARIAKVLGMSLDELMKAPENAISAAQHENKSDVESLFITLSNHVIKLNEGNKLRPLDEVLQDIYVHAIKFCGGNITQAADGLGMSRAGFYRKIRTHRKLRPQVQRERLTKKRNK